MSGSESRQISPFAELWRPHRYKVFYGGRGSGKSMAVAEYLIAFANKGRLRILCCREIQNSIRNSSYQLLRDTIQRLGLSDRYVCTESEIRNTATGSLFLFKGLSHNEDSIKSTEGIDIAWVEEAQSVSSRSLDILAPTVRKPNSELIFTLNPNSEDDPIATRYMKAPPADAYVRKVNYDENPFFPDVLRKEMEWDKANDYEKYLHVWEGYPLTISEAQIFKGRYIVEDFPDDLWTKAERLFFGADFGFAKDPSTLVRCFILDHRLYIDYEAYGIGVEIDELPSLYRSVPLSDKWTIYADCARPETISYLANRCGYNIVGADKWQGSIEDGIAYLKGFEKIVVHPRCKHTADEFRLYAYKTDKLTGEVLPIVLDKNNHCVAEGTLITTMRGDVPVERVTSSDMVLTRYGFRRVLACAITGKNREVLCIKTENHSIMCTSEHRIFTLNRGYVEANELTTKDTLLCLKSNQSNGTDIGGIDTPNPIVEATACTSNGRLQAVLLGYIGRCGNSLMAKFRRATTSTTKTGTLSTIQSKTLIACLAKNISTNIQWLGRGTKSKSSFLRKSGRKQRNGTQAPKESNGTSNTPKTTIGVCSTFLKRLALNVGRYLSRKRTMTSSAPTLARARGDATNILTMSRNCASGAESLSRATNIKNYDFVAERVWRITSRKKREPRVYDLTIDAVPEFFADGILVHNCIDGLRYAMSDYIKNRGSLRIEDDAENQNYFSTENAFD